MRQICRGARALCIRIRPKQWPMPATAAEIAVLYGRGMWPGRMPKANFVFYSCSAQSLLRRSVTVSGLNNLKNALRMYRQDLMSVWLSSIWTTIKGSECRSLTQTNKTKTNKAYIPSSLQARELVWAGKVLFPKGIKCSPSSLRPKHRCRLGRQFEEIKQKKEKRRHARRTIQFNFVQGRRNLSYAVERGKKTQCDDLRSS